MSQGCEVCKRGPFSVPPVTLYRQNELGVAGIWRCREHNEVHQEPEDEELIAVLEEAGRREGTLRREEA